MTIDKDGNYPDPHFRGDHSFSDNEWICQRCGRDWQDMRPEELDNCRGYRKEYVRTKNSTE